MLKERLNRLIKENNIEGNNIFIVSNVIVSYSLGLAEFEDLRLVGDALNIKSAIMDLKMNFLDSTHYMLSRFWRSIFDCVKDPTLNIEDVGKKYNVDIVDIKLAFAILSDKQKNEISERLKTFTYVEHPNKKELAKIIKDLHKFSKSLVNSKNKGGLYFIWNSDPSIDKNDLARDLLLEGIRIVSMMDFEKDLNKIKNKAIRSIKNYSVRLIYYYTANCRKKLYKVEKDDEDKDKPDEFQMSTISIDQEIDASNNDDNIFSLSKILKNCSVEATDEIIIMRENEIKLKSCKNINMRKVIKIMLGEIDISFDKNLLEEHGKDTSNLTEKQLLNYACSYYNVDKNELKSFVRRTLDL